MTVAVRIEPHVVPSSLEELAAAARREHELVLEASADALAHAIKAGEALLAARRLVPYGQWGAWLAKNFINKTDRTAHKYMRLAERQELVKDAPSIRAGMRMLASEAGGLHYPVELHDEANKLRKAGLSHRRIAECLDVSKTTVRLWTDPKSAQSVRRSAKENQRKRDAANAALRREERSKQARSAGGQIAKAWSVHLRYAQALERAEAQEGNPEARELIGRALRALITSVEEDVFGAVRLHEERT